MSGTTAAFLSTKGDPPTVTKAPTKSGFDHLDVNRLFKGKAAEPTAKQVTQKHGMQTLGKVLPARRAGAAALTFPSGDTREKSKSSGVETTVPSGVNFEDPSQGWTNQQQHNTPVPHLSSQIPPLLEKKWNDGRTEGNFPSSRFAQEFPSLDSPIAAGEGGKTNSTTGPPQPNRPHTNLKSQDNQYGPGPILRPQTEGSWTQGGGRRPSPPNHSNFQPDRVQLSGALPPQMSAGVQIPPSVGGGPYHLNFRPTQPSANYQRQGASGFYLGPSPSLRFGMPIPHDAPPPGSAGASEDATSLRRPTPPRPSSHFASKPIIRQEELERMDEIGTQEGDWASTNDDVDYNKKINFSDEEDLSQQKSLPGTEDEKDLRPTRILERGDREERPRHDEDWRSTRLPDKDRDRTTRKGREDDWRSGSNRTVEDVRGKKSLQQRDTRGTDFSSGNKFSNNLPPRLRHQQNQHSQQQQIHMSTPTSNPGEGYQGKETSTYKILERKRGESESSRDAKDSRSVLTDHSLDLRTCEKGDHGDDVIRKAEGGREKKDAEGKTTTSWAEEMDEDESVNQISEKRKQCQKEPSPVVKKEERRDRIESKRFIKQTKVGDMTSIVKAESPPSKPTPTQENHQPSPVDTATEVITKSAAWADERKDQSAGSQPAQLPATVREDEKDKSGPAHTQPKNSREARHIRPTQDTKKTDFPETEAPAEKKEKEVPQKENHEKEEKPFPGLRDGKREAERKVGVELMDDQFYKRGSKFPPPRKNSRESRHSQNTAPKQQDSESMKEDEKTESDQKRAHASSNYTNHNHKDLKPLHADYKNEESERRDKRPNHAQKQANAKPVDVKPTQPKADESKGKEEAARVHEKAKGSSAWGDKRKGGGRAKEPQETKEFSGKEKADGESESLFRKGNKSPCGSKRNLSSHARGSSRLQGYGPPSDRSPFSANTNKEEDEKKEKEKNEREKNDSGTHSLSTRISIPLPTSAPIPLMALGEISPPELPHRGRHLDYTRPPRFQKVYAPRSPKQLSNFRTKPQRKDSKGIVPEVEQEHNIAWNKPSRPQNEDTSKGAESAKESSAQAVDLSSVSSKVPTMVFENTKLRQSETHQQKGFPLKQPIEEGNTFVSNLETPMDMNKQLPLPFPNEPSPAKLGFGSSYGDESETAKVTPFHHQASRPYAHMSQRTMSPLQADLSENIQAIRSIWETPSLGTEPNPADEASLHTTPFGQDSFKQTDSPIPTLVQPLSHGTNGYASVVPSSVSVIAKPNSSASPTGHRQQMKPNQHSMDSQQQASHGAIPFSPFGYGMPQGSNAFGPIGGLPSPPSIYKNSAPLYQQFTHHDNTHVVSGGNRGHSQFGNYTNVGTGSGAGPYASLYLHSFENSYPSYATLSGPQARPPTSLQMQANNRISPSGLPLSSASGLSLSGMINSSAPANNAFKPMAHHHPHHHMAPIGPQKVPYSQPPLPPQTQPQLYIQFDPNQQSLMNLGQSYAGLRSGGPPPSATPPMQGLGSSSYYPTNPQGGYAQQNAQAGTIQGIHVSQAPNPHYGMQFPPTNIQPYNTQPSKHP